MHTSFSTRTFSTPYLLAGVSGVRRYVDATVFGAAYANAACRPEELASEMTNAASVYGPDVVVGESEVAAARKAMTMRSDRRLALVAKAVA